MNAGYSPSNWRKIRGTLKKRGLDNRLRRKFRVDARAPQIQQLGDAGIGCRAEDVRRYHQIVVQNIHRVGRIGGDPADPGGREDDNIGTVFYDSGGDVIGAH